MNGFGYDFEEKKINGVLFHSCTCEGLSALLQNYVEGEISFSTEESIRLFGRECIIVLEKDEYNGVYTPFDGDAGKYYGWDEFRVEFTDMNEINNRIEAIYVSDNVYDTYMKITDYEYEKELTSEEEDILSQVEWIEDHVGGVLPFREFKEDYGIDPE